MKKGLQRERLRIEVVSPFDFLQSVENQMLWVQRMNVARETASEIVNHNLIYA